MKTLTISESQNAFDWMMENYHHYEDPLDLAAECCAEFNVWIDNSASGGEEYEIPQDIISFAENLYSVMRSI